MLRSTTTPRDIHPFASLDLLRLSNQLSNQFVVCLRVLLQGVTRLQQVRQQPGRLRRVTLQVC